MADSDRRTHERRKVFIVGQQGDPAEYLSSALSEIGYEALGPAFPGEDAFVRIGEDKPDIALIDARFETGGEGEGPLERICSEWGIPTLRVVDSEDGAAAEVQGPLCRTVSKSANPQQLRCAIEIAMRLHETETRLDMTSALLAAVSRSQAQFISGADPQHLFDGLLENLISLTRSEYGFIDEIFHSPEGAPYRRTHAISNIAWSDETATFYEEHKVKGFTFYNHHNLAGVAMLTGRPVIANDPANDPRSGGGLPHGHPPIRRFLGLPLYTGGRLVGTVGLANRPGGYDRSLVDFLQPYLSTCANIIEAFRNRQERRRARSAVRESEERFRSIFVHSVDGILLGSLDGKVFNANPAACAMFGMTEAEISRAGLAGLIDPEDSRWGELLAERSRCGGIRGDANLRRSDGAIFPAAVSGSVFESSAGGMRIFFVIRDISESYEAERALREKTEALERSNQDLEQFAYVAAHDLRDPLIGAAAYLKLLERRMGTLFDEQSRSLFEKATAVISRMDTLIKSLLTYSRVTLNNEDLEPTDLNFCVSEAAANLRNVLDESGGALTCDTLPCVRARPSQFVRVFQNLVGNAVKFRSDAPPKVHIGVKTSSTDHVFSVADNGRGISEAEFERVFRMFQRGNNSSGPSGAGIGLAVCKHIVERHGGRIWVESELGRGSIFRFSLPKD